MDVRLDAGGGGLCTAVVIGRGLHAQCGDICHEQGMSSMHWRGVCRIMAILNLVVAPFVLVFLLIYFFMRNAEKFYHQPGSAGARRWSALAAWRLREFNELPHYLNHR